jgi:UDP-N-acetylglucosamine 3-dehydrogenase
VRLLRAGVIGLGTMGRHHARVLGQLPGVELVGACDPNTLARSAARGVTCYSGMDELLAAGLDLCVVAAPTLMHAGIGLRLASAGVHSLIEKPAAADVASAHRLAASFERNGLIGCVGHVERYNSALRSLQLRVRQGELGTVYQVATRRQGPFPHRIRDVGVVMDLATHDIDLTRWIVDSPYLNVAAFSANPSGRPHEDLVAVSGVLQNGTITSHLVNWLSPMKERRVTVTGERGCLTADTLASELWFQRNGAVTADGPPGQPFHAAAEGDLIRYAFSRREALCVELENFRDAVLGKPAEIVSLRQGAEAIQVASTILDAALTGSGSRDGAHDQQPATPGFTAAHRVHA